MSHQTGRGPYRSGSTYLVQLTLDRRVYVHAKQMALSGRRLKASIFTSILTALGVSPSDLAKLQSTDPAIRGPAIAALNNLLSQEPDGAFDAARFGAPGASGHAGSYFSEHLGVPVMLLAGFDLNESHLDEEVIDYGDPAITASEVVDRETLKAFVGEAGKYYLNLFQTEGRASSTRSRVALRDPNGPWRHGSVYLYVLDLHSNTILVHGAFPDRFELRPLVATVRDVVTGELILPQVIEAAKSNPEGGFVEYYFDDPTDDTDSADIPKLGYARRFKDEFPRADGSVLPIDVIIGSGLYDPAPDGPPEIALTVSPATLTEDGGTQTVTVTATQTSAPIRVASVIELSLSGTATADDYSVTGDLAITIPAGATEGSTELTFTVADDTVYESGGETIVITARSGDVDLDSATISVTDSYDAPATIGTPPAVTLEAGDDETVNAGTLFSGTDLSYSAISTDNGVVEAVMSGAALTVTGVRKGGATVTVSARNAAGEASLAVSQRDCHGRRGGTGGLHEHPGGHGTEHAVRRLRHHRRQVYRGWRTGNHRGRPQDRRTRIGHHCAGRTDRPRPADRIEGDGLAPGRGTPPWRKRRRPAADEFVLLRAGGSQRQRRAQMVRLGRGRPAELPG